MGHFYNYYAAFTRGLVKIVLISIAFGYVDAILNNERVLTESSRIPNHQEGQVHQIEHGKVSRILGTREISRKRQVPHPFSSTASPPGACECMDYWECISNNGHVYTYCGINDFEVCCFYKQKSKGIIDDRRNNNASNNAARAPIEVDTVITTTSEPPSTTAQFYTTGNEFMIPSRNFAPASTLPDVDYFYSLEDGVGDLKQITSTEKSSGEIVTTNPNFSGSSCGTQSVEWKINSKAEFSEWPWHVALLETHQDVYVCGGTLISNDKLITAAHCVHPYVRRNTAKLKVRAGEYDISTNDEKYPFVEMAIEKIFIHPDFSNSTLVNDIALIKLRHPLNYTENIRPICLPEDHTRSHDPPHCIVTGWGRESETSPFSIVLKEIVIPLWKHKDCEVRLQRNFGISYKLAETAICAGEVGHDACDGDGGGGLACYDDRTRRFYLKGITSFGVGCGRLNTPGVYTKVESYVNWIQSFPLYWQ